MQKLFTIVMAVAAVIPFGLSLYNSYYSDYQPQGRYLMPMLIPLMYFVTKGLSNLMKSFLKPEMIPKAVRMITIWIVVIMLYAYVMLWFGTYKDGLNLIS